MGHRDHDPPTAWDLPSEAGGQRQSRGTWPHRGTGLRRTAGAGLHLPACWSAVPSCWWRLQVSRALPRSSRGFRAPV